MLYIKNNESGVIEEICNIKFTQANSFIGEADNQSKEKLIITGYCKEFDNVLKQSPDYGFRISSLDEKDAAKLMKFGKYLHDRQKAAMFSLGNATHYILPQYDKALNEMKGRSVPKLTGIDVKSKLNSQSQGTAKMDGGILSILKQMTTTTKQISAVDAPLTKRYLEVKEDNMKKYDHIGVQTRKNLQRFKEDSSFNELHLPPMDKPLRAYVHDIIAEYDHLVSISDGDNEERHIVVYRKGFEPSDVNAAMLSAVQIHKVKTKRPVVGTEKRIENETVTSIDILNRDDVVRVHEVKRDRRSLEEIQEDIKNKRNKSNGNAK